MSNIIHIISVNLQLIVEHGGYLFLFIATILEGVPVIGQFVPGHTIIIIAGFLSRLSMMNIYIVLFVVIIGAMLGDIIGYYLGRKYGYSFLSKFGKYVFIKQEYIDRAKVMIRDNTIKTVLFGRFSPITRPLSPFIVGASDIHIKTFWFFDFIAVFIWSTISVLIGYIFGASYHTASVFLGKFIFLAIVIGLLVIYGYRFINKRFHIFAKYELITLSINLFGLYIFFKTIQDAITDKVFLLELDVWVNNYFLNHTNTDIQFIMNIITNIFSPLSLSVIIILLAIYFIYKKQYNFPIASILSLGGGYGFALIIKNVVARLRPEDSFIIETGYSFPSGHSVAITIFIVLIVYYFIINIKSLYKREILITLCVLTMLNVSFSRIYLGVHWLSDVIAGIGLGLFWTTSVILFVKYVNVLYMVIKDKFRV